MSEPEFSFDDLDFNFFGDAENVPTDSDSPSDVLDEEPVVRADLPDADVVLSDDAVDSKFAELVAGFEDAEAVVEAASTIVSIEDELAQHEEILREAEIEQEKLRREEEALEKALAEIKRKKSQIRANTWEVRSKSREVERTLSVAKNQLQDAKQNVEQESMLAATDEELQRRAEKCHWFKEDARGFKILPHQLQAAKFLATTRRGILGDGMGLGKTLSAIAALDLAESKRALIIAPAEVSANFFDEIRAWAPNRMVVNIKGKTKAERNINLDAMNNFYESFIIVVNYEAWWKDTSLIAKFGDMGFDSVVIDEAHVIKNTATDSYKGVQEIVLQDNVCPLCPTHPVMPVTARLAAKVFRECKDCGWKGNSFEAIDEMGRPLDFKSKYFLSKSVKNIWFMSGTPILNHPGDLYPLLSVIDPHQFESKNDYLRTYCEIDPETQRWSFQPGGLDRLIKIHLKGKFLARTLEDANIILPPQKPIKHTLTLTKEDYPQQREIVDMLAEHAMIVLGDNTIPAMEQIALITRQRQANVWPGGIVLKDGEGNEIYRVSENVTESIKIDKAVEIIVEKVNEGERVSLFSQFKEALKEIHKRINGLMLENGKLLRSVEMHGGTHSDVKDRIKRNFDAKRDEVPEWDVVLCQYKSGGVGLNLTAARHLIILDREWNPGKENQALKRNHRIGQTKETFVHMIEVEDSIDVWLDGLIEAKAEMIDGFNHGTQEIIAEYLEALKKGRTK